MNINQQSLQQALEYSKCRELPKQWRNSDDSFWINAIVLVKKRNGDLSYAIAERSAGLKISYTRDFGRMSPIVGLVKIFPYIYLDVKHYLGEGSIEELTNFLRSEGIRPSIMSEEELRIKSLEVAIECQKQNRYTDIKNNYDEETPKEDLPDVIPDKMRKSGQTMIDEFGCEETMTDISLKPKKRGRRSANGKRD